MSIRQYFRFSAWGVTDDKIVLFNIKASCQALLLLLFLLLLIDDDDITTTTAAAADDDDDVDYYEDNHDGNDDVKWAQWLETNMHTL